MKHGGHWKSVFQTTERNIVKHCPSNCTFICLSSCVSDSTNYLTVTVYGISFTLYRIVEHLWQGVPYSAVKSCELKVMVTDQDLSVPFNDYWQNFITIYRNSVKLLRLADTYWEVFHHNTWGQSHASFNPPTPSGAWVIYSGMSCSYLKKTH